MFIVHNPECIAKNENFKGKYDLRGIYPRIFRDPNNVRKIQSFSFFQGDGELRTCDETRCADCC